jgi:hypothetical protein
LTVWVGCGRVVARNALCILWFSAERGAETCIFRIVSFLEMFMKRLIMLLVSCNILASIYSEQINTVEELNSYGGKTIERICDKTEQLDTDYSRLLQYFDADLKIMKVMITTTKEVSERSGIKEQIQYYTNGRVEKYEMFFTDSHMDRCGFNRLTEEFDAAQMLTKSVWYSNDTVLDVSTDAHDRFQFYNIDFIENAFFENYKPNDNGDKIIVSAKYYAVKSLVKFDSTLTDLEEKDVELIAHFSRAFELPRFDQYYSKKVKVFSAENTYWLYVQTPLEQYVQGQTATVHYYPIGRNKDLYLICVGFYDVKP